MGALSIDELKELRREVVGAIADNPDVIAADPSVDYATVLELVRTTGRTDLFKISLDKVRQIEDKVTQAAAWVEVLDAIETEISLGTAVQEEAEALDTEEAQEPTEGSVDGSQQPEHHEQPEHHDQQENQHHQEHHQQ